MLRFDLFEFLERSLRGLVDSLRNLAITIALLIRHPVRGPRVAERWYRDQKRRQIGGLTLLFLAFFISLAVFDANQFNPFDWPNRLRLTAATGYSVRWSSIWPVLVGGLVSTIATDVLLRTWLRASSALGAAERRSSTEVSEYALFLPIICLTIWLVVAAVAGAEMVANSIAYSALAAMTLLLYGAALATARVFRRIVEGASTEPLPWYAAGSGLMMIFLVAVAVSGGAATSSVLQIRNEATLVGNESIMDFVVDARCQRDIGDGKIYVVMDNWSDRALLVDLTDTTSAILATRITTDRATEYVRGHHLRVEQQDRIVVIEPGRTAVIPLRLSGVEEVLREEERNPRYAEVGRSIRSRCYILPSYYIAGSHVTASRPRISSGSHAIGRGHVLTDDSGAIKTPAVY